MLPSFCHGIYISDGIDNKKSVENTPVLEL